MTAESVKKKQLTTPRPPRPPTELQQKIISTKQAHPSLNKNQIAAVAGCDHAHVHRTLKAYGIIKEKVDSYISNRAMILAGVQHRLLSSITSADIKKTPVGSRILAAAQLYDKERLETGKTTGNLAVVQFQMPPPDPVPDELKAVNGKVNVNGKVEGDQPQSDDSGKIVDIIQDDKSLHQLSG